jgi:hypothetical protein
MSLELKKYRYADPYFTNWFYLTSLTSVQLKALKEMTWDGYTGYIHTELLTIPKAGFDRKSAKSSVKSFINFLTDELMEL